MIFTEYRHLRNNLSVTEGAIYQMVVTSAEEGKRGVTCKTSVLSSGVDGYLRKLSLC